MMTTTESVPASTDDEVRDYYARHVTWCTNRDSEYEVHSDDDPYCSHLIHAVPVIPDEGDRQAQLWAQPTHAFVNGRFTPAQHADMEKRYNGIEMTLETWDGKKHRDQHIRMTSDAARTLAAVLIRAADLQQGLTR